MEPINTLRDQIDLTDKKILNLIAERMQLVEQMGELKAEQGLPALDEDRWRKVVDSRLEMAEVLGVSTELVESVWNLFHQAALKQERMLTNV